MSYVTTNDGKQINLLKEIIGEKNEIHSALSIHNIILFIFSILVELSTLMIILQLDKHVSYYYRLLKFTNNIEHFHKLDLKKTDLIYIIMVHIHDLMSEEIIMEKGDNLINIIMKNNDD